MVPIYENYKGYSAPDLVMPTVSKLIAGLPQSYLSGLRSVVLTNSAAVAKGKTRRVAGRKYIRQACLGFYHRQRKGQPAYVELVVDNILAWGSASSTPERDLTDNAFADVLFHEIGHHLDYKLGAPAPSGEAAAEAWRARLSAIYLAGKARSSENRPMAGPGLPA